MHNWRQPSIDVALYNLSKSSTLYSMGHTPLHVCNLTQLGVKLPHYFVHWRDHCLLRHAAFGSMQPDWLVEKHLHCGCHSKCIFLLHY